MGKPASQFIGFTTLFKVKGPRRGQGTDFLQQATSFPLNHHYTGNSNKGNQNIIVKELTYTRYVFLSKNFLLR